MTAPTYSAADYQAALLSLLPRGRVWPRDMGTTLAKVCDGLTRSQARLNGDANALLADAFPITANDLLPEWEDTLGLPDPCLGPAPTLAQRQASVKARLLASGGDSIAYYTAYAAALGYSVTVRQNAPFRIGLSGAGDPIGGEEWWFVWDVIAVGDTALLKCELGALVPAHTVLRVMPPDFDSFEQALITPSDSALLTPGPFGGLYFPSGGRAALEDADGQIRSLSFRPGDWFYGLIPVRIRATGSDAGLVVYGLYGGGLSAIPPYSGARAPLIAPRDTGSLSPPPRGGLYVVEAGTVSLLLASGAVVSQTLPGDTWLQPGLIQRVNATGTDIGLTIYGFTA